MTTVALGEQPLTPMINGVGFAEAGGAKICRAVDPVIEPRADPFDMS
ncbi:hypothetical protein M3I54_40010 [Paraburkholderia sp. CNPSo 3274]|nr:MULTISPECIES: hypothetical protein [unclassified Paraburkholderia]MCP3713008.1 hypothetical protein [Paraburkholderia sp. CNPSo 3274]MCP3720538.1 hypothetical protein [Paraburkholderia sp. CNPSo 3281]